MARAAAVGALSVLVMGGVFFPERVLADKIVEPSKVAPEFREAAEKRRAEQIKLIGCNRAAQDAKVLPRDRAKFVSDCIDKPE